MPSFFYGWFSFGELAHEPETGKIQKMGLALIRVEILVILMAALEMILLSLLYSPGLGPGILAGMRYAFILPSAVAGFLVGLEFPLAGGLFPRRREGVARTAGILYAADLFGAFTGFISMEIIRVPVLGIVQTCVAILFLKASSLVLPFLSGLTAEREKGLNSSPTHDAS